jgi:hypothetical protein
MRLSVNLDQDVYDFASAYANARGLSLSAATNELIRRAEEAPMPEPGSPSSRLKWSEHGYLVISGPGDVITPEIVKQTSEDPLV